MKSLLGLLALSLMVTGCGKGTDNSAVPESEGPVISLQAKSGMFTGSADFGVFAHNATSSKLVTFTLKNEGTEALNGPATLDNLNANYSLSYSNCPASLAVKKTCTIKVAFDPRLAVAATHTANLNFDSVFVALTAVKEAAPVVTENAVSFLVSSVVATAVDFGSMTEKQSVVKTITIKNNGLTALTETVTAPSGYVLSYDACSGKAIAKNTSCQIKVTLSGLGKSGVVAGNLTYAGKSLSLTGEVITVASGGNASLYPIISFLNGDTVLAEPANYDFGSFTGVQNQQLVLTIKNTGSLASTSSTATLNNSNFSILYNQCLNKPLEVNASCQVRLVFRASGKSPSTYSSVLSFAGKSLTVSAKVELAVVGGAAQKLTFTNNNVNSEQSYENVAEYQSNGNFFTMERGAVVNFRITFNQAITFDAIRFKENYLNVSIKKSDDSVLFSQALSDNTAIFSLQTISAGDYITISLQQQSDASGSDFQVSQLKDGKGSISHATKNGVPQPYGPSVMIRRVIHAAYFNIYRCDGTFEGLKIRTDLTSLSDIETTGFTNNQTINGYTSSVSFGGMSASKDIDWSAPWEEVQQQMDQYPYLDLTPSGLSLAQMASHPPVTVPMGYDCFNYSVQLKQLLPFSFSKFSMWVQ